MLIGSSFVFGYQVPYEQTFGVLLQKRLSRLTGRKVEVDNQGLIYGTPLSVARRFGEALAAKPDMILWAIPPWDVEFASGLNTEHASSLASNLRGIHDRSLWERLSGPGSWFDLRRADWRASAVRLLLQHILYQSESQYIHAKLMQNDSSGFLFKETSEGWAERWRVLGTFATDLAARSRAAGVPLVLTALPDRAEASLISAGNSPRDIDPFAFGRKVRSAADTSGSAYLDLLPSFRTVPAVERLYYPVDGHMDGEGCALLARFLADSLIGGIPSLTKYDQGTSGRPNR